MRGFLKDNSEKGSYSSLKKEMSRSSYQLLHPVCAMGSNRI